MSEALDIGALSGVMAKVILVLERNKNGLSMADISRCTGVRDLKNLRKACRDLEQMPGSRLAQRGVRGHVIWVLLEAATGEEIASRSTERAAGGEKTARQPDGESLMKDEKVPARSAACVEPGGKTTGQSGDDGDKKGEKITHQAAKSVAKSAARGEKDACDASSLKDSRLKELSLNLKNLSETDSVSALSEAREPDKRLWLEKADLLFSRPVTWHASFAQTEGLEILAWLAQAHEAWREKKSDRPWGLVYKALRGELRQKQADKRFRNDPLKHLPQEYLEACGLALYRCRECGLEFGQRAELETHCQTYHPPMGDELDNDLPEEDLPEDPSPATIAWQSVLRLFEQQMPRGSFATWLEDTRALDWDEESGVLRVLAADAAKREWLDGRVRSSASRMLCGILNCAAQVQFVCEGTP